MRFDREEHRSTVGAAVRDKFPSNWRRGVGLAAPKVYNLGCVYILPVLHQDAALLAISCPDRKLLRKTVLRAFGNIVILLQS